MGRRVVQEGVPMTTRTTLGLGSLVAAIVLSLALVSSASARPTYHKQGLGYTQSKSVAVSVQPKQVSGSWRQHTHTTSLTVVPPKGPATRVSHTGAPSIPVTVVEQVQSSGFNWTDAAIGALIALGMAIIAVYAAVTLRGRRGGLVLRS
jgi:hypothetical protein